MVVRPMGVFTMGIELPANGLIMAHILQCTYACLPVRVAGRRDLSIDTYAYIHCITLHYITLNIHMYMYDLFMYMAAMAIGKQKETFPSKEAHGICQDASDTSEFQSQIELMLIS